MLVPGSHSLYFPSDRYLNAHMYTHTHTTHCADPVLAPEYFAVVYIGSRFSRGRGRDEAEKASQEVDAEVSDGWNQCTAKRKSFFHSFRCARFSYSEGDVLQADPFYSLDPFSVTHVDLLNRAFDYLVLALKEILLQGIRCRGKLEDRNPAFFLAALFIRDNVHGQLLEPHVEHNVHLDPISKEVVLWKRCDVDSMTMLEHFTYISLSLSPSLRVVCRAALWLLTPSYPFLSR